MLTHVSINSTSSSLDLLVMASVDGAEQSSQGSEEVLCIKTDS